MNLHEELTLKVKEVIEDYEHMLYTDPWVLYDKVADLIEQELQEKYKENQKLYQKMFLLNMCIQELNIFL